MNDIPNVKILVAKCVKNHKLFGMRAEEVSQGSWNINWAFPIEEHTANSEKYNETKISGAFNLDGSFPECPHCRRQSFYKCGSCERLACWDTVTKTVTCPFCNHTGDLDGTITDLKGGGM